MATASTGIEWTDATWNPVTGCTKLSPGCDNCYAERIHERFHGRGSFAVVARNEHLLYAPLRWRAARRVFVNSMSDLFHADVPADYIAAVWSVMARAERHTFQILTKRHARARHLLTDPAFPAKVAARAGLPALPAWPLPNVWLGVSIEDQRWTDTRLPRLLDTPAAVRFISAEPLLGPIRINDALWTGELHWVIAGGESGPAARPMNPTWPRQLRDQCTTAAVPFFFKQWGEWQPGPDGRMRRVGKHAAGRELDGRTWDQYPTTQPTHH